MKSKKSTGTPQQPVIAALESQLAQAEADASPADAKVRELESATIALKKDLGIFGGMPGVADFGMGHDTDLPPEEMVAKKKQLDDLSVLLVLYRRELAPRRNAVNNARSKLKSARDHVEDRKQRLAKLHDEGPAKVKAYREQTELQAKQLIESADRREEEFNAEITAVIAEIRRYEGVGLNPDAVDGKNVTPKQQPRA